MDMKFKDKDGAKLGDYVQTERYGYQGRICAKHHSFKDTNKTQEWFDSQQIPFHPSTVNESWYSILVKNGGSVTEPEQSITEILEPFELNNVWESYYFNL
jgi:hypothetical protein